jgi:hypothetical protein
MGPALRRGSEGGHVEYRAGIVDGCGRVRVRGIDNSRILKPHARDPVLGPFPPPSLPRTTSSLQAMDANREYELHVRQQPKQARMCGVGGIYPSLFSLAAYSPTLTTADRRPIDPPPIVQLRVLDKARKNLPSPSPSPPPQQQHQPTSHPHAHTHESTGPLDTSMLTPAGFGAGPFLQNPYYFMFASLAKPDDDTELHWMKVRSVLLSSALWPISHSNLLTLLVFSLI